MPAHATGTAEASADGILTCTFTFVNGVGNRPLPKTPYEVIGYSTATAFSGVNYAVCVVI